MKIFFALCSFSIIFQLSIAASSHDPRKQTEIFSSEESKDAAIMFTKRGVAEFTLMGLCYLAPEKHPHEYLGYGCYCGIGGKGEPVDETDRCCQVHDECYTSVQNSGDCPFDIAIYAMPYTRKNCYQCEPASYYWFYGKCRHALCKCDSEAVQCFKRSKFNPELKYYTQDKC